MVKIVDFLINFDYTCFLLLSINSIFYGEVMEKISVALFLLFWNLPIIFILLFIYEIFKGNIFFEKLIKSFTFISILFLIFVSLTVLEKNKELDRIRGFDNFNDRDYVPLTKRYTLEKIGLEKYVNIDEIMCFSNDELNEIIKKIDTIINIDNNFYLSLDEKTYFKKKLIDLNYVEEVNDEIHYLIEKKKAKVKGKKRQIFLEKQKEILENL